MRAHRSIRLLLATATLLAAACGDASMPQEPRVVPRAAAARVDAPVRRDEGTQYASLTHWADGYLLAPTHDSDVFISGAAFAFNRAGRGTMSIAKPAGTTGRYVVTFTGLSALLGSRSTVHVTPYYAPAAIQDLTCKPAAAYLASDRVEVRCFRIGTGQPVNTYFTLLTTRNYADLAFAYAHLPTGTGYTPDARGSWNPAGATTVTRIGVGQYRVTFGNLAAQLPPGVYGHVQANAVGTTAAYCNPYNSVVAGGHVNVDVRCFAPLTGAPVDERFTVLFAQPAEHLAYVWADKPTVASYAPLPYYSSNPAREPIAIARQGVGIYKVTWTDLHSELLGSGNVQVSAYGSNAQCKFRVHQENGALIQCFAPNGASMDSRFTALIGS